MPYLIIIVAVVSFFALQIPQHHHPALKSNQKLQQQEKQSTAQLIAVKPHSAHRTQPGVNTTESSSLSVIFKGSEEKKLYSEFLKLFRGLFLESIWY